MNRGDIAIFALNSSRDFGEKISARLGIPLSAHEEREFEDGEHKSRPLVSVRGKDVFVVQSLYSDPQQSANDKLCRLLFFVGALETPRLSASALWCLICATHARIAKASHGIRSPPAMSPACLKP